MLLYGTSECYSIGTNGKSVQLRGPARAARGAGRPSRRARAAARAHRRDAQQPSEGPRRYGKTSLLNAALARPTATASSPIYVNFLGVLTAADVAERIERAYREQLDGRCGGGSRGSSRRSRPRAKAAPGGVGVEVAPETQMPEPARPARAAAQAVRTPRAPLRDRLRRVPGRRAGRRRPRRDDPLRARAPRQRRRLHLLRLAPGPDARPLLRSPPRLLRPGDARRARPARRGGPRRLHRRALRSGGRDPGEALEPLLRVADGHPQRAMLLAHHLYENTRPERERRPRGVARGRSPRRPATPPRRCRPCGTRGATASGG